MASRRKTQKRLFFNYFGSSLFCLVLVLSTHRCDAWDPQNCPNFCACFWLYGLKWADCTGHRLYSVQTGVDEAVQALDISNNSVASLANYELRDAGLTRLKLLNLSSNAISEIGLAAFFDLSQLRVLDLSRNHLYYILPDTFVRNKKLEVLELAGNNLNRHVPKLRSSSLGSLDLGNCGISHLPADTFDGLPRLRALDLTDNMMIQFELDILKELPNLGVLMIERNPWSCNNEMRELQKRLRAKGIVFKRVCDQIESPDSNNVPKKFEKMIAPERPTTGSPSGAGRLLAKIKNWKNSLNKKETTSNRCQSHVSATEIVRDRSLAESLDMISPYWFLAVGFLLGSATSTILTYFWLARTLSRPLGNLSPRVSIPTDSSDIANQRVNLLQHLWQSNDDTSRSTSDCPGTPPPPYRDVMLNSSRYPVSSIRGTLIFANDQLANERPIHS